MNTVRDSLLSLIILAAVLLCAAVPRLQAETLDRCQRRVAHAEQELHEAIRRHGSHSMMANHERRELHNARERCWRERHQWWNEHERRWHKARDWDEPDHDKVATDASGTTTIRARPVDPPAPARCCCSSGSTTIRTWQRVRFDATVVPNVGAPFPGSY